MDVLFKDKNGRTYREDDIDRALHEIHADDCDTIFLHSDLTFGDVPQDFKRSEYLQAFSDALHRLPVKNIIVPTFTYSFCNHENYDVLKSRTTMGALNEFLRKQPNRYRTLDPLLSVSVPDSLREKFSQISHHSLGEGSGLDYLHHMGDVKILFLGASPSMSFTYLHYVEKMLDVPYRFDMPFTGTVIDETGKTYECTQYMHTACTGVKLREGTYLEDHLIKCGYLEKRPLGNGFVSCITEADAYKEMKKLIEDNPYYFLEYPYQMEDLKHEYTYDAAAARITHC